MKGDTEYKGVNDHVPQIKGPTHNEQNQHGEYEFQAAELIIGTI